MEKNNLIHVGTFGQPVGLKGEIRINILTTTFANFKMFKSYFMEDGKNQWNFKYIKSNGKKVIGLIEKNFNRDLVEKLQGKKIFCLRDDFPKIKSNEYYLIDLKGCTVKNKDNKKIGTVKNLDNFGAGDLLEVQNSKNKKFYIPFDKNNLISIDLDKKIIITDPLDGIMD